MADSPVSDVERLRLRARPRGLPVMRQRWRHLGFLHWAVDPVALAALLPRSLELDTWQGQAFVGVVPFTVHGTRPPFLPAIPWLSDFHELNVRTYVHRRGRDPGVWFFSLDAASRLAVWGARATYKLPYFHASIALAHSESGAISFSSRRAAGAGGRPRFACSYQPSSSRPSSKQPSEQSSKQSSEPLSAPAELAVGTRDFFLVERYLLYSWDGTRLRSARVWHQPYPIAPARIADLSQDVTDAARVEVEAGRPPIAHYCREVDVRIYAPTVVKEPVTEAIFDPTTPLAQPQLLSG
ncbi:MAG TPA: DUF2071 domain-containing protein [Polyangia bacterium]|jgi:hypothetical protein|nr:DUF2071 domain-containing protein [Polyangia bacterium]